MRFGPVAIAGLLLALAPILAGCGGGQAASAGGEAAAANTPEATTSGVAPKDPPPATAPTASRQCGRQLGDFLDSIESLNNSLAVGLGYEDYLGAVSHVRASYASVEADRLPLGCLARVGDPSERALDVYIDAANAWGECLSTASCSTAEVEPQLQRRWSQASALLVEAEAGLRGLG